jgi:hypothetical protein
MVIGGYGKGEGGVESLNGQEKPHNNLDLLLVSKGRKCKETIKRSLDQLIKPISERYQIEIDTSVVKENQLRLADPLLIWYEMSHAHKLIIGDPDFASSLNLDQVKKIPSSDIYALMVNRGTLLIINEWLLKQNAPLNESQKKVIIKHTMKAIIGLGDAYLFFTKRYHWSYREKQFLMQKAMDLPEEFRKLYDQAAEFRFKPDYQVYLSQNLAHWLEEIRFSLALLFLRCESLRLKKLELSWNNYLDNALAQTWKENFWSLRSLYNKIKGVTHFPTIFLGDSISNKIAFYLLSPQQRLGIIYPFIAFDKKELNAQLATYLLTNEDETSILEAYLKNWGQYYDLNFFHSLGHWKKEST